MTDFTDGRYKRPLDWIKKRIEDGKTLDFFTGKSNEWLDEHVEDEGWPENPEEYWNDLVEYAWMWRGKMIGITERTHMSTVCDENEIGNHLPPEDEDSSWQLYRTSVEQKYDNIDTIEVECLNILNHLSSDTSDCDPVKGLVVGYVQSGKTANITGLISMAADFGWNMFIVLSGTIESLRHQNQERLYDSLCLEGCRHSWFPLGTDLDKPEYLPQRCDFSPNSQRRYLTVCLKNKTRLVNLLRWLNADQNKKKQMKVLLIDDEADQASINTARPGDKRNAINDMIIRIVDGRDAEGNPAGPYAAMNYVSYTATPYANFLSEGDIWSLYPHNFITLLTPSDNYIGPVEIFGAPNREEDGLGVVGFPGDRFSKYGIVDVSEDTDYAMERFYNDATEGLPDSLRDAICWFLCCAGVLRRKEYRNPVSMLVQTSQSTDIHKMVANGILKYLQHKPSDILADCRRVYATKTAQLPKDFFVSRCIHYGRSSDEIDDYPEYDSIEPFIEDYLNNGVEHIRLDKNKKEKRFCDGIHLCIDNCKNDVLDSLADPSEDESLIPRLVYPDKNEMEGLKPAPAFLVVGGNTLSRGLTLDGLVSTYFSRRVSQGDTLMQMGRWFGFRIGYELLPRMWMSAESYVSFEKLIEVDESLREFIRENYDMFTPKDFPPMVKQFPKTGYLTKMTSASKSRAAEDTGYDFDGTILESSSLCIDVDVLENNLSVASNFIESLGPPEQSDVGSALVWRGIPRNRIFGGFLSKFVFSSRTKNFNEIDEMERWVSKKCPSDWNVILASVQDPALGKWTVSNGISVNKVGRSVVRRYEDKDPDTGAIRTTVNIKALSSPEDRFADLCLEKMDGEQRKYYESNKSRPDTMWRSIRHKCGLEGIPAIIIYCISSESPGTGGRQPMDSDMDVVAVTVVMPGKKSKKLRSEYLQIPPSVIRGE